MWTLEFTKIRLIQQLAHLAPQTWQTILSSIEIDSHDFEEWELYQVGELRFECFYIRKIQSRPQSREAFVQANEAAYLRFAYFESDKQNIKKVMEKRRNRILE